MTPQATKPLEDVFCSKTRIKILKLLIDLGQLNVSEIAERLGSNYAHALTNLTVLEDNGVLRQLRSGRTKYYRLNEGCLKVSVFKQVILAWQE